MTRQSNSWGHTLYRLAPRQIAPPSEWDRVCRVSSKCRKPTTHLGTYSYVTGRAGRVSWARRFMCDDHAQRFRAKHDLPELEAAPDRLPRHALERILEEGRP